VVSNDPKTKALFKIIQNLCG